MWCVCVCRWVQFYFGCIAIMRIAFVYSLIVPLLLLLLFCSVYFSGCVHINLSVIQHFGMSSKCISKNTFVCEVFSKCRCTGAACHEPFCAWETFRNVLYDIIFTYRTKTKIAYLSTADFSVAHSFCTTFFSVLWINVLWPQLYIYAHISPIRSRANGYYVGVRTIFLCWARTFLSSFDACFKCKFSVYLQLQCKFSVFCFACFCFVSSNGDKFLHASVKCTSYFVCILYHV